MAIIHPISADKRKHRHEAYPPKFDLSSRFDHLFEDDMQSNELGPSIRDDGFGYTV